MVQQAHLLDGQLMVGQQRNEPAIGDFLLCQKRREFSNHLTLKDTLAQVLVFIRDETWSWFELHGAKAPHPPRLDAAGPDTAGKSMEIFRRRGRAMRCNQLRRRHQHMAIRRACRPTVAARRWPHDHRSWIHAFPLD